MHHEGRVNGLCMHHRFHIFSQITVNEAAEQIYFVRQFSAGPWPKKVRLLRQNVRENANRCIDSEHNCAVARWFSSPYELFSQCSVFVNIKLNRKGWLPNVLRQISRKRGKFTWNQWMVPLGATSAMSSRVVVERVLQIIGVFVSPAAKAKFNYYILDQSKNQLQRFQGTERNSCLFWSHYHSI